MHRVTEAALFNASLEESRSLQIANGFHHLQSIMEILEAVEGILHLFTEITLKNLFPMPIIST
jgi:hypothetical protein